MRIASECRCYLGAGEPAGIVKLGPNRHFVHRVSSKKGKVALISGGLAGLAGAIEVAGRTGYVTLRTNIELAAGETTRLSVKLVR